MINYLSQNFSPKKVLKSPINSSAWIRIILFLTTLSFHQHALFGNFWSYLG